MLSEDKRTFKFGSFYMNGLQAHTLNFPLRCIFYIFPLSLIGTASGEEVS